MTGPGLHVLVVGAAPDGAGAAIDALTRRGHTVSHVTPMSGTPFLWPADQAGTFDIDTVRVVLAVPGDALSAVPWCEERVIGLVHRGVPLVLAGTPPTDPYTAWASLCVDPRDDLVRACETVVDHRAAPSHLHDHDHGDHVTRTVFDPIDFRQSGGEALSRPQCLDLLATARVGRVGLTSGALPVVVPVDYRMWQDQVVFRTAGGSRLHHATTDAVVAFEVDALGPELPWGWSVVVTGMTRDITDSEAAGNLSFPRQGWWTNGTTDRFMAVPTDVAAGCRLPARSPAELPV